MAKDKITDYDATNANNTDVGGVNIDEGCPAPNMNNMGRELMSHLAETNAGTYPVADTWSFADPGDLTKIVRLDAGNVTAGQTRVITAPDADLDLANITRVLSRYTTITTVTNSTTETTVFTFSVPANTLSTDRMLRLSMLIGYTKNATGNLQCRMKYGSTTVGDITLADAELANSATVRQLVLVGYVYGRGSTSAQTSTLTAMVGSAVTKSGGSESTEDSTGALNLVVTLQFSAASGSLTASMRRAILEVA